MQKHIFNVHDVVLFMTLAECLLLVAFQTLLSSKNLLANRLLSFFLISIGLHSACVLVLWNDEVNVFYWFDYCGLPYFLVAAELLKGPLLLFYVIALTEDAFHFRRDHLVHCTPLFIAFVWLSVQSIDSLDLRFLPPEQTRIEQQLVTALWYFIKIIPFCYALAATNRIRLYRIGLHNQYSDFSSLEPRWLNILSLGFLFAWGFSIFVHLIANTFALGNPHLSDIIGVTENYIIFILINALFINSIAHTHQLLTTKSESIKDRVTEKPTVKTIEVVLNGMEEKKLFLKSNLNIEEFSKRIGLSVKEVSCVINKHFKTNFFEFMNSYRVKEAKRLLGDPALSHKTVMDILLEAGFNSKSAFHRFFSRLVGMSPTEYRKHATKIDKLEHP